MGKAILPLAICLLSCLISMIAAKPSPRYFLIESKGKNNDYQADYANFYWEGSSRYRKNRGTGSGKGYRLHKPNDKDYKDTGRDQDYANFYWEGSSRYRKKPWHRE